LGAAHGHRSIAGINNPGLGPNGTVYVAADIWNSRGSNAIRAIHGTYAHEKANILDAQINPPNPNANQNARPYQRTYGNPNDPEDADTGAAVERCMFGSLQYPQ
jgi:hypothetical protein